MTSRETMRALVDQAYAARDRGDAAGVVAAFRNDGVFQLAGNKGALALAGSVEGHANLKQAMTGFVSTFEFSGRKILSFVADGERAAVHSRLTVKYKPTGSSFTTDVLDLFTFKDGKVSELVEFADTALIKDWIAAA